MKYGEGYVSSQEIRDTFIKFFTDNAHTNVGPSSIVPNNDPTLLFINSGMAPLKPYFTGDKTPPTPDLCNFQPCIRTNDIEDIGDRHHLSFFEMMGSWSINNYFKERAIELAYGLLVDKFGFPPEKLYATVYGGNEALGIPADKESIAGWKAVGVPEERIVVLGDDNFWGPAGETGPCGPCTEVFFDTGDAFGPKYEPGGHFDDKSRYIEIWNAGVFMEFNKQADGSFSKLPFTSVDTGSGLERMEMAMNGHASAYETDLMKPQMDYVATQLQGVSGDDFVRAQRQITDHMRTVTFMLGENVNFSNEGRGYVPRRLARKVIALVTKHAKDPDSFNYEGLIQNVIQTLGPSYDFLAQGEDRIITTFNRELQDFRKVIDKGLSLLDSKLGESKTLSGEDAFELFATYGMPRDLLREFTAEKGGSFDEAKFDEKYREHQTVSRAAGDGIDSVAVKQKADSYLQLFVDNNVPETTFTGYNDADYNDLFTFGEVKLLLVEGIAVERVKAGDKVEVLTDRTPFYGEGGGQIGDTGVITTKTAKIKISDTQKIDGRYYIHFGEVETGQVSNDERVKLKVDSKRRQKIVNNHSATHLLQSALISVLGDSIRQRGSIVTDEYLRFDFTWPKKVTPGQLAKIEQHVNSSIRANAEQVCEEMTFAEATAKGAIAFTGDKYGEQVRVIAFGHGPNSVSIELCGGTHVKRTGDIGTFKVLKEESISSGVRRIIATTGEAAVKHTQQQEEFLRNISELLKTTPDQASERILQLIKDGGKKQKTEFDLNQVKQASQDIAGVAVATVQTTLPAGELREFAIQGADQIDGVVVLTSAADNKASIVVAVGKTHLKTFNARDLLSALMPLVDGRGGGKDRFAQGGGAKLEGLTQVADTLADAVQQAKQQAAA